MKIQDFFRKTYNVKFIVQAVRPHIQCHDGFEMSVQAGIGYYCTPRVNLESGKYTRCEVGFPNMEEDLLTPYAENADRLTGTVYGYVPVDIVDKVIEKHGGMIE